MRFKTVAFLMLSSMMVGSVNVHASDDDVAPAPLQLKEHRDQEIRALALYQLKRRLVPIDTRQGFDQKVAAEQLVRMKNESIRDPVQQSRSLNLNPNLMGVKPTVYSSANYSTTMVFVDKFGNPWDIQYAGVGASSYFSLERPNPYTLLIYPKSKYKKTNLTVTLKGMVTPFVFDLTESKDRVDYVIESKIAADGPNTKLDEFHYSPLELEIASSSAVQDKNIKDMIDGITPSGEARPLVITRNGEAMSDMSGWEYNGDYYIRTNGEVISPSTKVVGSPSVSGEHLFKAQKIDNLIIERDGVLFTDVNLK
ncbi:DotH/IcmK family type IV secretion protein [Photobacterium kishitanii]|uniref:Type IV secretion protein DotH n=1 Tax=Photobacterium kishitanii TaxID=318456 RepID=A0A2T3KN50_9GAMM|nr:DotH/IcmK family type IV secretion protein [Photobacterium kishitanii]PSV01202.1 hypothetical protein C9J27_04030 [Photobacterium kishitanii]